VDEWNAWRLRVAEGIVEVRPPAQRTSPGHAVRKEKAGEEEDKEVIEVRIDQVIEKLRKSSSRISGQSLCVVRAVHISRSSSGPTHTLAHA
jgi:hypothetical protein